MKRNQTNRALQSMDEQAVIKRISFVGIVGNILLTAFKLFAGVYGHSAAMVSDAVHSLSDVFATLVAFMGITFSKKTADPKHPYGHERMECIASLLLGGILFATGLGIGKVGVESILFGGREGTVPEVIALIAAVVSIVSKEAMYWYTRHYAILLDSSVFMADAWHHRSDAFSSIGSLIGIGGAMLGFPILDSLASLVICVFILKVACDILKDAVEKMMDTSCGEAYEKQLAEFILRQDGVEGIDVLRSRMFGSRVFVDLEIIVDGRKSLYEAHGIADQVHSAVEREFTEIKHIMIHVNPKEECN